MRYILALAVIIITVSTAGMVFSQEKSDPPSQNALEIVKNNFDVGIIDEADALVKEANVLLKEMRDKPDVDTAKYLNEVRPLRGKISKRSPLLRTLIESLQRWKFSLPVIQTANYGNPYYSSQLSFGGDPEPDRSDLNAASMKLQDIQFRLQSARALPPEVADRQQQIDTLIAEETDVKKEVSEAESAYKKAKTELIAARDEQQTSLKAQVGVADDLIQRATSISRNLDETLSFLDDASGSLLQSNIKEAAYTDRSTFIFAILVGGVIIGFFIIAFISPRVREAIFTGDSGIQFVTLFSLVIAIILFGVLKILEGKELSALLGGLSGYILGKAGQSTLVSGGSNTLAPTPTPLSGSTSVAPVPAVNPSAQTTPVLLARPAVAPINVTR
jgi:uncharacterized protein YoxC